jgi:hypothetical protein
MTGTGVAPAKVGAGSGSSAPAPSAPARQTGMPGYWIAFALALCLGAAAIAWSSSHNPEESNTAIQEVSAAFRDGLYSGRRDAKRGIAPHVATGRWSTQGDRASFATGYKKGYDESIAMPAPLEPAPKAN